jgi:hypothetical protein
VRQAGWYEEHIAWRQGVVRSAADVAAAPFGRRRRSIAAHLAADGDFCVPALDDENVVERRVNLGFAISVAVDDVNVGSGAGEKLFGRDTLGRVGDQRL